MCLICVWIFEGKFSFDIYNRIVNILFDVRNFLTYCHHFCFPLFSLITDSCLYFFLHLSLMGIYSLSQPISLLLSFLYLLQWFLSSHLLPSLLLPPILSHHRLLSLFFPSSLFNGSLLSLSTHKSLTFFPLSPSVVFVSFSHCLGGENRME